MAEEKRIYQPLDVFNKQIRVLQVHPGEEHEDVRAELIITRLPRPSNKVSTPNPAFNRATSDIRARFTDERTSPLISYNAISYTWGDPSRKRPITLNGVEFEVPTSAIEVLKGLRSCETLTTVWVDAICINQNDIREREYQVAMMGEIYSNASQTRIWLGPATDLTEKAFGLCSVLRRNVARKLNQRGSKILDRWDSIKLRLDSEVSAEAFDKLMVAIRSLEPLDLSDVVSLEDVFSRKWFQRLWVFQEVVLSRRCTGHIGRYSIPWMDVMVMAAFLQSHDRSSRQQLGTVGYAIVFGFTQLMYHMDPEVLIQGSSLYLLLGLTDARLEVSDSRDRIYALLSMTKWTRQGVALPDLLRPDYSKSLRECMRDATAAILLENGSLKILHHSFLLLEGGNGVTLSDDRWPSWTPVWHTRWPNNMRVPLSEKYCADNLEKQKFEPLRVSEDFNALFLEGFRLGFIEYVSTVLSISSVTRELSTFKDNARLRKLSASQLWKLLTAEIYKDNRFSIDNENAEAMIRGESFRIILPQEGARQDTGRYQPPHEPQWASEEVEADKSQLILSMARACTARRVFTTTTSNGSGAWVGLCPQNTRTGDFVVILFGSTVPFVLRPRDDGTSALVGSCYVQDAMDGQATQVWRDAVRAWKGPGIAGPDMFEIR